MNATPVEKCLEILQRIARLFPHQVVWHVLIARLKAAHERSGKGDSPPTLAGGETCACCAQREPKGEHGLCDDCRDLFEVKPARIVADRCDCGHEPKGSVVFVYRPENGPVLCSVACARSHWKKIFGFFIGRLSCPTR